jgi:hypothetical protein
VQHLASNQRRPQIQDPVVIRVVVAIVVLCGIIGPAFALAWAVLAGNADDARKRDRSDGDGLGRPRYRDAAPMQHPPDKPQSWSSASASDGTRSRIQDWSRPQQTS